MSEESTPEGDSPKKEVSETEEIITSQAEAALSPEGVTRRKYKDLLESTVRQLTPKQNALRDAIMWTAVNTAGADLARPRIAEGLGVSPHALAAACRRHEKMLNAETGEEFEVFLSGLREASYQGVQNYSKTLIDVSLKALLHLEYGIEHGLVGYPQYSKIIGVLTDKYLLVTGQPTARIARTGEDHKRPTEELKAEAEGDYKDLKEMGFFEVIDGGKKETDTRRDNATPEEGSNTA